MRITLLTQAACDLCEQAKETLDRMQADYGFELELGDLRSRQGQATAAAAGVLFAPGVLIDGEPFSYGRLSERKLRKELDRRTTKRWT